MNSTYFFIGNAMDSSSYIIASVKWLLSAYFHKTLAVLFIEEIRVGTFN